MEIYGVAVIALCAVVMGALLKKTNLEHQIVLAIGAVAVILVFVLEKSMPLLEQIQSYTNEMPGSEYLTVLVKAVGITIIGQITIGICKDAGEAAIAQAVEIAARVCILLLSLPLILTIFTYIKEILMS